jgi:hypothetical protein
MFEKLITIPQGYNTFSYKYNDECTNSISDRNYNTPL